MTQPEPQELANKSSGKQIRLRIAIGWGLLIGSLTFAVGPISSISENPILGIAQRLLMILLLPGLIGAGAISGNMHAFDLAPGALINALFNFGLSWLLLALVGRFRKTKNALVIIVCILLSGAFAFAQMAETDAFQNAKHQYQAGHLAEAERGFRELVSHDPSNVAAHMYLGQTLFREQKFSDAIAPYEKVRDLEKAGAKLTLTQHRILGDQLAMAYGISGRTADSKALLKQLVRTDPAYPLNYYNLACVAADEGDKPGVLKNLTLAFQHRAQILPGEQMPDPASDPSFQKYANDADFKALVSHLKG
jgi:tetratricopeptide (TPR) repeat protein